MLVIGVRCEKEQVAKEEIENMVKQVMKDKYIGLFSMDIYFVDPQGASNDFRKDRYDRLSVMFEDGRISSMEWER